MFGIRYPILAFALVLALPGGEVRAQTPTPQPADNAASSGASSSATGIDCTDIYVEYKNDPMLTAEENSAAMDAAFHESLSKFDYCITPRINAASEAASGGGGGGGGGAAGGGELTGTEPSAAEEAGQGTSTPSQAASDLSGTETPPEPPEEEKTEQEKTAAVPEDIAADVGSPTDEANAGTPKPMPPGQNNGVEPEDIPPAENDSILEAQIRRAAVEETDPEVKKRLWNEYRKYKGLPAK